MFHETFWKASHVHGLKGEHTKFEVKPMKIHAYLPKLDSLYWPLE